MVPPGAGWAVRVGGSGPVACRSTDRRSRRWGGDPAGVPRAGRRVRVRGAGSAWLAGVAGRSGSGVAGRLGSGVPGRPDSGVAWLGPGVGGGSPWGVSRVASWRFQVCSRAVRRAESSLSRLATPSPRSRSRVAWTASRTPGRRSSTSSSATVSRCISRPTRASNGTRASRSSGSVRAATHNSRAATKSGPVKAAPSRSITRSSRCAPRGSASASMRNSSARRSARWATAAVTRAALVG